MRNRYIGDRGFYRRVMALTIPIMVQNGITNFVNMLDNVMIGQVSTVQMNGVSITNQLIFVFNLCVFGVVSGAGIFGAQFYGKQDHEGVRHTFRFKALSCLLFCLLGIGVFLLWGEHLTGLYLQGEGNPADVAASHRYALSYLHIMLIGFIPYTLSQCYSSTLRECDNAVLPMVASMVAVGVNLSLNYVLIFGKLGAPSLGVNGAAIATVLARFVELGVLVVFTWRRREKHRFIVGAFRSLYIPCQLVREIVVRGMPLMLNEALWAAGMATLSQCYSVISLDVVAANNISQTFFNVFSVAFMAVGMSVGIILGQLLGAGKTEEARLTAWRLIIFSVFVSAVVSAVYFVCAAFLPLFFNTNDDIRGLATGLMRISALAMPLDAFANASYFTLRSGGKVFVTFLFDSCFVWGVAVPVAFVLSRYTGVGIFPMYAICQGLNFLKDIVGFVLVKKGIWVKNMVADVGE